MTTPTTAGILLTAVAFEVRDKRLEL